MDKLLNPFSPGAGTQPPELAGRTTVLDQASLALARVKLGRFEKSVLLIGLRGVGKTVLLNCIHELAGEQGYQSIMIEAREDRSLPKILIPALRQILLRLDRGAMVSEKVKHGLAVLKSFMTSTFFFVASLVFALQPALAASCSRPLAPFSKWMQLPGSTSQRDDCVCDKSLRNLEATLPKQMKIIAACGLQWNDGTKVNLSTQKASLDIFTDYKYIWYGEIFITGTAKLSGPFTYEIGETEHVWLDPVPPLIDKRYHSPLAHDLDILYFDDKDIYERFYAFLSKSKTDSSCITANATIEIDGIHLTISEGDEAGAYPVKFNVVSIGGFKSCANE